MHSFAYMRPYSLQTALDALDQHPSAARVLAGGTDLIVQIQKGRLCPAILVDLKHIPELAPGISFSADALRISALTPMHSICAHLRLAAELPALAEAAACVGSPQIRNRATLGGNLCNASPAADTASPLLALGASVSLAGPAATRTLPLHDFFTGPGETARRPSEIMTSICIPLTDEPRGSAFERLTRRRGVDLASVNVACCVYLSGRTVFGLGAVAPTPLRAEITNPVLASPDTSAAHLDDALKTVADHANPITDIRAGRAYRVAMVRELLRRAHARALARLSAKR